MEYQIIGTCPLCGGKMTASKLTCGECGVELVKDFSLNRFDFLSKEDLHFIELFLKHRGNLKEMQKSIGCSYPAAKKHLDEILTSMELIENASETGNENAVTSLPLYNDDSSAVKQIKKCLNEAHGSAVLSLTRGNPFTIHYEPFGNGIIASNIPKNHIITWEAFDRAVELMRLQNGRALKGNAMKAKLGEKELSLDTVEGYVAHHAYHIPIGSSVLRTISALSSILEWAGICENGYGWLALQKPYESLSQ